MELDEALFLRALRALAARGDLLVATDSSLAFLAQGLEKENISDEAAVAEWLVDQDAVVDLLASNEDIRSALVEAGMPSMVPPPASPAKDADAKKVRAWWKRVEETAARTPCDAILCYVGDEMISARGLLNPSKELESYAASDSTTLPDDVRELEWNDISMDVALDEDASMALLERALEGLASRPVYAWNGDGGELRRVA